MLDILVVTERSKGLADFLRELEAESGLEVVVATSSGVALERVKADLPPFVVLDEGVADGEPFQLAMDILTVNAMTNMAAITRLSDGDFHEASEGLGFLCSIPWEPQCEDAKNVAELFKRFA